MLVVATFKPVAFLNFFRIQFKIIAVGMFSGIQVAYSLTFRKAETFIDIKYFRHPETTGIYATDFCLIHVDILKKDLEIHNSLIMLSLDSVCTVMLTSIVSDQRNDRLE